MRRQPSLRSQLNQIRLWVRQGRTDAWIAHKLDIGVDELTRFKGEHQLDEDDTTRLRPADPLSVPAPEPRAEEPEDDEGEQENDEPPEEEDDDRPSRREREGSRNRGSRPPRRREPRPARDDEPRKAREARPVRADRDEQGDEDADGESTRPRRRRGRRGGRRHRGRRSNALEATFDHGEEGYGLWLDPAVVDNPLYSEHWAGHRAVTVTVEAETITIRRAGADRPAGDEEPPTGPSEEPPPDELDD